MKYAEIKKMSDKDLAAKLTELKQGHRTATFMNVAGGLKETHTIKASRKDIARVLTEMNARKGAETTSKSEVKADDASKKETK